jgi:hypothetical protein
MVQPKYSPEEALERVKLMMGYDSSKTLNENRKIIFEQDGEIDIYGNIETIKNELDGFTTDEGEIVKILKNYDTKQLFDDFLKKYKDVVKKDLGTHFGNSFTQRDRTEWNELNTHLKPLGMSIEQKRVGNDLTTEFKGSSVSDTSSSDKTIPAAPVAPPPIPKELVDAEGVKKFQDWLDKNYPGWASGYKGGILNKSGRGYGRFGPRTTAAWDKYKNNYTTSLTSKEETPVKKEIPPKDEVTSLSQDDEVLDVNSL